MRSETLKMLIFCVVCSSFSFSQNLSLYFHDSPFLIPFTNRTISIDGDLDDWINPFSFSFRDTNNWPVCPEGFSLEDVYPGFDGSLIRLPKSRNEATIFLCWNKDNLYLAFNVKDNHLMGQWIGWEKNAYIYLNDAVEVYIDSKNDSEKRMDINDYQFSVDVHNQKVAFRGTLNMIDEDYYSVPKESGQNLVYESAVKVAGRLNGKSDTSGNYIVEIRIPFLSIGLEPEAGDTLRFGIGVEDADYIYSDLTHPKEVYYNWAFDWTGYNDFGYPSVWKAGVLTGRPSMISRLSARYQEYWMFIVAGLLFASIITIILLIGYSRMRSAVPSKETLKEKGALAGFASSSDDYAKEMTFNERIISEAVGYIRENCRKPLRSEEVANHLSVSIRTLQRITGEEMDCTPTSLISLVRLRMAAEFLKAGRGNVSEAAFEHGFSDPGYFSRLFRQHFGIPPSEYISQNN